MKASIGDLASIHFDLGVRTSLSGIHSKSIDEIWAYDSGELTNDPLENYHADSALPFGFWKEKRPQITRDFEALQAVNLATNFVDSRPLITAFDRHEIYLPETVPQVQANQARKDR